MYVSSKRLHQFACVAYGLEIIPLAICFLLETVLHGLSRGKFIFRSKVHLSPLVSVSLCDSCAFCYLLILGTSNLIDSADVQRTSIQTKSLIVLYMLGANQASHLLARQIGTSFVLTAMVIVSPLRLESPATYGTLKAYLVP